MSTNHLIEKGSYYWTLIICVSSITARQGRVWTLHDLSDLTRLLQQRNKDHHLTYGISYRNEMLCFLLCLKHFQRPESQSSLNTSWTVHALSFSL